MSGKTIAEALNVNLSIHENDGEDIEIETEVENSSEEMQADFEFARKVIKETIEQTQDAFEDIISIAKDSEHPRAFEVMNQMAVNLSNMSKSLVELHKQIHKEEKPQSVTNNNVLITTTEDVIKRLRAAKEEGLPIAPPMSSRNVD